jgi:membrane fusion protein, heavy metal efflux system
MFSRLIFQTLLMALATPLWAEPASQPILLDEAAERNLQLQSVPVQSADFEQSFFALGSVREMPDRHAVVSSRISGRVLDLKVQEGDFVKQGEPLVRVESRQPGDPPPSIELSSPIQGLVISTHVRLGEPVEPDKELMDISDLSEMHAIARVPEHQAASLHPGSIAHITVPALGKEPILGEMIRFGTAADRESGTIDAIFRVKNPGLKMRNDMRAEFSIVTSLRQQVLSVPRIALQGDAAKRFLYVRHPKTPHAFEKRSVEIGEMNDRLVEIVKGLNVGDQVVTQGAYSLSFAGAQSLSLKEALDAAHGHSHAADGSELPSGGEAKGEEDHDHADHAEHGEEGHVHAEHGEEGHDHEHEGDDHDHDAPKPSTVEKSSGSARIWQITSGVLFALLLTTLLVRKPRHPVSGESSNS